MELENLNKEYPRVMMVSDKSITKDNPGEKRVVYHYNPRFYYAYECYPPYIQSLEDLDKKFPTTTDGKGEGDRGGVSGFFRYAQDYKESTIELTLEEIADKFNIDINQLRIKD